MAKKPELKAFEKLIEDIAASLLEVTKESVAKKKWRLAYVDRRSPPGGGSSIGKYRIEMQNGHSIRDVSPPMEQSMAFMEIEDIKANAFEKQWYGIKLIVTPNGKHAVEFNYDPDCINDPTFYDMDES